MKNNNNILNGLTSEEVKERMDKGLVHKESTIPTKSIKKIILGNVFTLFNILNFIFAFFILYIKAYKNVLFMGTVIFNTLISIINEIRAKKIVDKLTLLNESKVNVIRDGKIEEINKEQIVIDEIIDLKIGNSVIVDSIIEEGELTVNESFITGENDPVIKKIGDEILSGSYVLSGKAKVRCIHIGENNYTSKICKDAKYVKKSTSIILNSFNKIIKILSFIIIPVGIVFFIKQYQETTFESAIISTVAALLGMIPEGLILLTSTVLAISIIRLSKYKVLVQELYSIETLARVDELCLDKTGTITEGKMEVVGLKPEKGVKEEYVLDILNKYTNTIDDHSPTMEAVRERYSVNSFKFKTKKINYFSSDKKYSSIETEDKTYYFGAPDFILKNYKYEQGENRCLLITEDKKPLGLIMIRDKIRENARETLEYFRNENVNIKIISGDNPVTVSNIAKRVGLKDYDKYIDMSTIKTKEQLKKAYLTKTIFGRTTPIQKKELIILSKEQGHCVAMTGDGVNDCLALKEADFSICMAEGSEAARNVSEIVLLDSNFECLPKILLEGRRCINNIGRSASLYLVKTVYTSLLVLLLLLISFEYPFKPIQLTMMNAITIGIPSLILALEPNKDRVKGDFLKNIFEKSIPMGVTIFITLFSNLILCNILNLEATETTTICIAVNTILMIFYLIKLCIPFNKIRMILVTLMSGAFALELIFFRNFFQIELLDKGTWILAINFVLIGWGIWQLIRMIMKRVKYKQKKLT